MLKLIANLFICVGLITSIKVSGQVSSLNITSSRYISSLAVKNGNIFAGTYGSGVFMSTDNGASWIPKNTGLSDKNVWSISIKDSLIYVGTEKGIFKSINNGETWVVKNNGLTDKHIWAIASNDNKIFIGTLNGVFLSTNQGNTWTSVSKGLIDKHVLSLATNGRNIFAGTKSEGVFVTTNNGNTWRSVNTGIKSKYNICSLICNNNKIYAGNSYYFEEGILSKDSSDILWDNLNNRELRCNIHCIAIKENNIFVGKFKYGDISRFNINNKEGSNLQHIKGLSNVYDIRSILVNGNNIFIGTWGYGVFLSNNDGESWIAVNNGLINNYDNNKNILDGPILEDKIADSILRPRIKTYYKYNFNLSYYTSNVNSRRDNWGIDSIIPKNGEISKELELFLQAAHCNFYAAYLNYLRSYPNGLYVKQAKICLTKLMYQKAIIDIKSSDSIVYPSESPYYNVASPFWDLSFTCKEIGGKIRISVYKDDGYIINYKGEKISVGYDFIYKEDTWSLYTPDFIDYISSKKIKDWVSGKELCNRKYYRKIVIVDDAGNIENKYQVFELFCK
ncbi:MAG: WD40/YVTN/BNR-like repeat-containing protein [Bacteroidales bacterium]